MGYSVQQRHVGKLPPVGEPKNRNKHKYQIQDSIVGWSDAVKIVAKAFLKGGALPTFDYRDIREKGAELITTGGLAPGPTPLKVCLEAACVAIQRRCRACLTSHRSPRCSLYYCRCCTAGGIRRAAMISLFDRYDEEMITCKSGNWWETHPYRGRANNSAVLPRGVVTEEEFSALMKRVEESGCGEPGVYWSNDLDWGTNPML